MKKLLIVCLIFLLILPGVAGFAQSNQISVERISGQTRYDTSIRTSQAGFSQSSYAVIASGQNFPDAMAGGQLAGYLRAPLLITSPTGISSALQAELQRLGVDTVYLLGGQNVLSDGIFRSLAGQYSVKRLSGRTRLETSIAIANEIKSLRGQAGPTYYTASNNFPDALASAPLVVAQQGIMYLNDPAQPVSSGIALGGRLAVPGTPSGRISGGNRYETAVAMAQANPYAGDSVVLVSGLNYPDALSASGYAAIQGRPILLTDPNHLSGATANYLKTAGIKHVTIIGGRSAVSDQVLNQIAALNQVVGYDPNNPKDGLVVSPYPGFDIKGNISWSGEKIYHVPGQRDYAKTVIDESRGERWFKTEQDARNAGWRKALQ